MQSVSEFEDVVVKGTLTVNGNLETVNTTVINREVVKPESIDSKEKFVVLLERVLDHLEEKNRTIEDLMCENQRLREIRSSIMDILEG